MMTDNMTYSEDVVKSFLTAAATEQWSSASKWRVAIDLFSIFYFFMWLL